MNRRGFISKLRNGLFVFTVLPPALTYHRNWKTLSEFDTSDVGIFGKGFIIGEVNFNDLDRGLWLSMCLMIFGTENNGKFSYIDYKKLRKS